MTKEQILEYAGKGDVEHNGFIINVIKKDFDNVLKDFIEIELKPINEYTDGPIHTYFRSRFNRIRKFFEKRICNYEKTRRNNEKRAFKVKSSKKYKL